VRRASIRILVVVYVLVIAMVPFLVAVVPIMLMRPGLVRWAAVCVVPVTYGIAYVLVAGGLSCLTRDAIVSGKYPRDLGHPVYGRRRLYALCWTSVYYFSPLYHVVLAVPALKWLTFRLFGYQGALDFTAYADTWIRDLPLLQLGSGAYLANKATIGTNMCLNDGTIVVMPVRLDTGAMVGHLALLGPGCYVGPRAEVGVGASVGMNCRIEANAAVGPLSVINHGAIIGEGCHVGNSCLVGTGARLAAGARLRAGAIVEPGQHVSSHG